MRRFEVTSFRVAQMTAFPIWSARFEVGFPVVAIRQQASDRQRSTSSRGSLRIDAVAWGLAIYAVCAIDAPDPKTKIYAGDGENACTQKVSTRQADAFN
jgi:hypothetical protein